MHGASCNCEQCNRVFKKLMENNIFFNQLLEADKFLLEIDK